MAFNIFGRPPITLSRGGATGFGDFLGGGTNHHRVTETAKLLSELDLTERFTVTDEHGKTKTYVMGCEDPWWAK